MTLPHDLQLLLRIGADPTKTKEELADAQGIEKSSLGRYLYSLRERNMVVKTMRDEDREKGYVWEITGKGRQFLEKELQPLQQFEGLEVRVLTSNLHAYRPPHARRVPYERLA